MAREPKSGWEIADILLKPLGGLLTALSVALVGFYGSQYLEQRQAAETNVRLYAELMSNRERADSDLRKDMFNMAIKTFLNGEDIDLEKQLLELELLAYNFHDALDLAPLFKHVERKISSKKSNSQHDEWRKRLTTVAREVTDKQSAVLADAGQLVSADLSLEKLKTEIITLVDVELPKEPNINTNNPDNNVDKYRFTIEALDADATEKSVLVRLRVEDKSKSAEPADPNISANNQQSDNVVASADNMESASTNISKKILIDTTFNVDFFDFPMIDNSRLPDGRRCAVVLRSFHTSSARLSLLYFPGSRASLKDKPFYDEIIDDLVETREKLQKEESF